jgi:UbiD family decarboxylase
VYLTSGLDYAIEPETGLTNVGARRLSLRNKTECGTNVTARSHLREIYLRSAARKERLPITFTCGSHPLDFMAAGMRIRQDEVSLVGTLRGEPVPLVKSLTNDIWVPADAELILEGYLHEFGYSEPEGPYGEYMGFYGPMHLDPVFVCTAITMRKDVLHQSLLHGSGKILGHCESANLSAARVEAEAFRTLKQAGLDVRNTYMPRFSGEGQHVRVSIKQHMVGQGKRAIHAIFAAMPMVKHVWVVDEDVDVTDDSAMDWAMGTRFQANKNITVLEDMPGMQMDPSLDGKALGAKAGFDMTKKFGQPWVVQNVVTEAKKFSGQARYQTVQKALEAEPHFFTHLMESVGSRDGREVAAALDELRRAGKLGRDSDGRYHMVEGKPGHTVHVGPEGHDPNML